VSLWRVYYADGSACDDSTPLDKLPRFGAIAAIYSDASRLCVAKCHDWFVLHRDQSWTAHNDVGLAQVLAYSLADVVAVLIGVYVSDATYTAIHSRAISDPDFPIAPRVRP